jgi:negative regulator of sigma E activity
MRIYNMDTVQLKRIADILEEVLKLVKADQERTKKYLEEEKS